MTTILRYSGLPDAFEFFNPAKVTAIDGAAVSGTAGNGNPCPNCVIELFLDDNDGIDRRYNRWGPSRPTLAATGASPWRRRWSRLRHPHHQHHRRYGTIPNMNAGTTAGLSVLYNAGYKVHLPLVNK